MKAMNYTLHIIFSTSLNSYITLLPISYNMPQYSTYIANHPISSTLDSALGSLGYMVIELGSSYLGNILY